MFYSFIIPVYNRPEEVDELLKSLSEQTATNFEVVIVEDGSSITCEHIVDQYKEKLTINYYFKPNSGPGDTRNYGAEKSQGDYLIILDSDCIIPPDYLKIVEKELGNNYSNAFGGPDKAHSSFTPIQKAINYAMTSFFTTGGIRGSKKSMDKFYPRSFNMGVETATYKKLNGFSKMRFGEDIDFSIRIFENGYKCRLFPDAWVYHKRRTDLRKFFKQVHNSGIARINLYKKYPDTLKTVHLLPSFFTISSFLLILISPIYPYALLPLLFFSLLIFVDATIKNKNIQVGFLSIIASFVQLWGYGTGFIIAWWKRIILGKNEFSAFKNNFYK